MAANHVLPRFFSVFVSHFSSNSFLIPSTFNEHLPRRLPKIAILMGITGRTWKVGMTRRRYDQVYFKQGWETFVTDNEIKDGELLTFVFDGHKTYQVSVYGRGGCKEIRGAAIEMVEISDNERENDTCVESLANDVMVEELSDDTKNEKDYSLDGDYSLDDLAEVANTSKSCKKKKTIENPEAYLDDPHNIHFETRLKNTNYMLVIDGAVVKDNDLKFGSIIEYIDQHGSLTARVRRGTSVLVNGWNSICRRNEVKKNDSILCELRRNNNVVYAIKIHIIRGGATATED